MQLARGNDQKQNKSFLINEQESVIKELMSNKDNLIKKLEEA